MPLTDPYQRYQDDPQYHALVDTIHGLISRCDFTPSEVRQAAVLACIHFEASRIQKHSIPMVPELEQALQTINKYANEAESKK